MICKVLYRKYINGLDSGFYGGMEYNFRTNLPLEVGAKVLVPSGPDNELKRAIVTEINIPEESIEPRILKILKDITEYDPEGGNR